MIIGDITSRREALKALTDLERACAEFGLMDVVNTLQKVRVWVHQAIPLNNLQGGAK